MIITPELFYKNYQVNYFDYKQLTLKAALESPEEETMRGQVLGYDKSDYKRTLKSSIRQVYFHSIETLMELVFALMPNKEGIIEDDKIYFNLLNSKHAYKKLEKHVENNFEVLDKKVFVGDKEITLGHYIFYHGFYVIEKKENIEESLEAIKIGLTSLAKDFIDRDEYNSYKHGLRVLPTLMKFKLAREDDLSTLKEWDLSDSMSYYKRTKNTNEIKISTKVFDTKRDIEMTSVCSNLIWNIITLRRYRFCQQKEEFKILFFGEEEIKKSRKHNINIQDLNFNFVRVNERKTNSE